MDPSDDQVRGNSLQFNDIFWISIMNGALCASKWAAVTFALELALLFTYPKQPKKNVLPMTYYTQCGLHSHLINCPSHHNCRIDNATVFPLNPLHILALFYPILSPKSFSHSSLVISISIPCVLLGPALSSFCYLQPFLLPYILGTHLVSVLLRNAAA